MVVVEILDAARESVRTGKASLSPPPLMFLAKLKFWVNWLLGRFGKPQFGKSSGALVRHAKGPVRQGNQAARR
jgi:hypothetical protein